MIPKAAHTGWRRNSKDRRTSNSFAHKPGKADESDYHRANAERVFTYVFEAATCLHSHLGVFQRPLLQILLPREEHSTDQCRYRPELSDRFGNHCSIWISRKIRMHQSLVDLFFFFREHLYGPMALKARHKSPPRLVLVDACSSQTAQVPWYETYCWHDFQPTELVGTNYMETTKSPLRNYQRTNNKTHPDRLLHFLPVFGRFYSFFAHFGTSWQSV